VGVEHLEVGDAFRALEVLGPSEAAGESGPETVDQEGSAELEVGSGRGADGVEPLPEGSEDGRWLTPGPGSRSAP
jgi:hypothetical protein